jgi:hypothetical protein
MTGQEIVKQVQTSKLNIFKTKIISLNSMVKTAFF